VDIGIEKSLGLGFESSEQATLEALTRVHVEGAVSPVSSPHVAIVIVLGVPDT
jgi:hypothetical protein